MLILTYINTGHDVCLRCRLNENKMVRLIISACPLFCGFWFLSYICTLIVFRHLLRTYV